MDRGHPEHEVKQSFFTQMLERLGAESKSGFTRDRFEKALRAAGNPQHAVPTVVIAGTNGKGTVSLLVSQALTEAGFRVGTYLSPHLQHPRERFLFQGIPLSLEVLDGLAQENAALAQDFNLSYFEFLTLLAFQWARQAKPDYLVLEVGLGGRLDATNVTQPLATAITNIDWDHQAFLGDTREKILTEKMGILRRGVPVFTQLDAPLRPQLEVFCQEHRIPVVYTDSVPYRRVALSWENQRVEIDGQPFVLTNPSLGALKNAALAYQLLRQCFPQIPLKTLQNAFAKAHNPGRFETVQRQPRVVLSGDHNPAGITSLVQTLRDLSEHPHIVCGFSPDKPQAQMVEMLRPVAKSLTLTAVDYLRSAMPEGYEALAPYVPQAAQALKKALARCSPNDTLVVTGSLYLVGEVRQLWFKGTEEKLAP
ncbi:hypothetical protein K2X33_15760 [bacterium]|nr:hypothetical protein [bacterium]